MNSAIWELEQGIHARGRAYNMAMAAKGSHNECLVKASWDPNNMDSYDCISRGLPIDQEASGHQPGDASM